MNSESMLSYERLKVVLQYMEPNLRIRLSSRCPSIRSVEKAVPLKLNYLYLEKTRLTVNQTTYQLGVYQKFQSDEASSKRLKLENESGGCTIDVDRTGNVQSSIWEVLAPGGLVGAGSVDDLPPHEKVQLRSENMIQLMQQYRVLEEAVKKDVSQGMVHHVPRLAGMAFQAEWENRAAVKKVEAEQQNERLRMLSIDIAGHVRRLGARGSVGANALMDQEWGEDAFHMLTNSVQHLQSTITDVNKRMERLYPKRDITSVPCAILLQLTIKDPLLPPRIERYQYSMKLPEAMRSLMMKVLGGRVQVRVRLLERDGDRLQVPDDLKLKVRELKSLYLNENLLSAIDSSSHPLDLLDTECPDMRVKKDPRELVLRDRNFRNDTLEHLKKFDGAKLHYVYEQMDMNVPSYVDLIRDWLEKKKNVGTCFKFGILREGTGKSALKGLIDAELEVSRVEERSITIPMSNASNIVVSYEEVDGAEESVDQIPSWILKMEVKRI